MIGERLQDDRADRRGAPGLRDPGRAELLAPLALALLAGMATFARLGQLGFTGDDAVFFGSAINRTWSDEVTYLWFCLTRWPQGRPVGMGLHLGLVPHAVFAAAGLPGLYAFAWLIASVNAALLYRLLAARVPGVAALAGAAWFLLSPVDTVKLSLVFAYNFGLTSLEALLAVRAAQARRPALHAALVAACFLSVEPFALIALCAPVALSWQGPWSRLRSPLRYAAQGAVVVAGLLLARRLIGDPWGSERVGEVLSAPGATVARGLRTVAVGMRTYLRSSLERLVEPLGAPDGRAALVGTAAALAVLILGATLAQRARPARGRDALGLALAGLACMAASYVLYFRTPWYPASWTTGFMTGVHIGAALGAGLVFAGVTQAWVALAGARSALLAAAAPALAVGLLAAFGEHVQREHAVSWAFQREFWAAYRTLCADAGERTFVVALDTDLPRLRYIEPFSWTTEELPDMLFGYRGVAIPSILGVTAGAAPDRPDVITHPPVVIFADADLRADIRDEQGAKRWKPPKYYVLPKTDAEQPTDGNVIVLEREAGAWRRLAGTVPVDGGRLTLRSGQLDVIGPLRPTPLARVFGLDGYRADRSSQK